MLRVDKKFLFGKYRMLYKVECQGINPLEFILKKMMDEDLIDGVIAPSQTGTKVEPKLFTQVEDIKLAKLLFYSGQNTLLKKAIQKYRLNKIVVVAPSCILDGLNKTQYYGIGCNWTKTAVALKIGILCLGILSPASIEALSIDITGKKQKITRNFLSPDGYFFETEEKRKVKVDMDVYHHYINSGCRYCLNLSAKGSDITYVPMEREENGILIVRSERGLRTLSILQKKFIQSFHFKPLSSNDLDYIERLLKEKLLLNIDQILERVEVGLPVPKWNGNKFQKFYNLWNSINSTNIEEEVF